MQWIIEFFKRHATTLFFPMALILYDFAALSVDGPDSTGHHQRRAGV